MMLFYLIRFIRFILHPGDLLLYSCKLSHSKLARVSLKGGLDWKMEWQAKHKMDWLKTVICFSKKIMFS